MEADLIQRNVREINVDQDQSVGLMSCYVLEKQNGGVVRITVGPVLWARRIH